MSNEGAMNTNESCQGGIFWPMGDQKFLDQDGFFLLMSYFANKKFVQSKSTKNKLALKSEMNGSFLFVLFDLKTFLLIK